MLQIILTWYQQGVSSLQNRALWEQLHREEMRTAIAGMKYRPEDQWEEDFTALLHQLETLSQDEEEGL